VEGCTEVGKLKEGSNIKTNKSWESEGGVNKRSEVRLCNQAGWKGGNKAGVDLGVECKMKMWVG
jgi:hypothetical protein